MESKGRTVWRAPERGADAALGETAQVNGVLLDVLGGPIGEGNVEREVAEPFPLLLLQPRLFGQFGGAGVIAGGQGLLLKGIAEGEIDGDGGRGGSPPRCP